jgi:hypothetical protein
LTAAAEHGLAVGFGDTGSVGLGGITLGGGVGYLVRAHGLTIDALIAAELVTADGRIRLVDATSEPDLFWAIRGGGGNVGVATRFRFRLVSLPSVVGGIMVLPATPESIAGFIAAAEAAPDSLSSIANVMPCPPMPFVPEEHHGSLVILAMLVNAGDDDAGERAMAPFRALATPIADLVHPMPYPEIYPPDDPDYRPTAVAHTMFMDHAARPRRGPSLNTSRHRCSVCAARGVLGGRWPGAAVAVTRVRAPERAIMVNLAAFFGATTAPPRGLAGRVRGGYGQADPRPRRFPRRRRRGRRPPRLSRTRPGLACRGQAPVTPRTSSGNQNVPQPERKCPFHPVGDAPGRVTGTVPSTISAEGA